MFADVLLPAQWRFPLWDGMGRPPHERGDFNLGRLHAVLAIAAQQTVGLGQEERLQVRSRSWRETAGRKPTCQQERGLREGRRATGLLSLSRVPTPWHPVGKVTWQGVQ